MCQMLIFMSNVFLTCLVLTKSSFFRPISFIFTVEIFINKRNRVNLVAKFLANLESRNDSKVVKVVSEAVVLSWCNLCSYLHYHSSSLYPYQSVIVLNLQLTVIFYTNHPAVQHLSKATWPNKREEVSMWRSWPWPMSWSSPSGNKLLERNYLRMFFRPRASEKDGKLLTMKSFAGRPLLKSNFSAWISDFYLTQKLQKITPLSDLLKVNSDLSNDLLFFAFFKTLNTLETHFLASLT